RTAVAQAAGFFDGEIAPVTVPGRKGGEALIVDRDEHPRANTTAEMLAKLKPVFRQPGTVTAGNASGLNDGAAAMLLASAQAVRTHGLTPRARVLGFASAGVEPAYMGIGPVPATQRLLARLGLTIEQFDAIELNEAFAAQALACTRAFGLADDAAHVNANGGAIALGHPLGMSGARLALTLLRQLEAGNGRLGLASMCIGVGQGVALAIERV
ncbi:MAG: acetyl-CoA C-acyltransferase, partial [Oxalobacteraceae bacterium]